MSPPPNCSALLAVYDEALPAVYGYLLRRCGDRAVAEDLTSETFVAAMDSARRANSPEPSLGWLIGVARHKLADHWRRSVRTPTPIADVPEPTTVDHWDAELDRLLAQYTLTRLTPLHRAVLTLRYVDDCMVGQCAEALGRSVAAVESLLTRAKREFRDTYPTEPKGGPR